MTSRQLTFISLMALVMGLAALDSPAVFAKTRSSVLPLTVMRNGAGPDRIPIQSASLEAKSGDAAGPPSGTVVIAIITNTETLTGSLQVATAIARFFNVTADRVTALHDSGHGYGEIVKAYLLAQETGKSVNEVFGLRAEEQGWGQLLHTLAVSKWDTSFGKILHGANAKQEPARGTAPGNSGEHRQDEVRGDATGDQDDAEEAKKGKSNDKGSGEKGNGK